MGTITGTDIITQASELAKDESNVVWSTTQGLEWINDAQRAICVLRPDANVSNHSVQLIAGTKQAITGRRLMHIMRNMGTDGLTAGIATRLVDKKIKDEFEPDWHTETAATAIDEYVYDPRDPKVFYVSPPVHAVTAVYVELAEAVDPTDLAVVGSTIDLDDIYVPVIIEWVAYRFFGRDSENTPNHGRALQYLKNFYQLLGQKLPIDVSVRPKINDEER